MAIEVFCGDITTVDCDGILTLVSGGGPWKGGIDEAIRRVGGPYFHRQAEQLKGQPEGSVLVVPAPPRGPEEDPLRFAHVVFVVDNLEADLGVLLKKGLMAADREGLRTVAVPALRLGLLKEVAGTPEHKLQALHSAAQEALAEAVHLRSVAFVFYGDDELARKLYAMAWHGRDSGLVYKVPDLGGEIACFSPRGDRLAYPTWQEDGWQVKVVESVTGCELYRVPIQRWYDPARVDAICMDPEGERVAVALRFGPSYLYRVSDGELLHCFARPKRIKQCWTRSKALAFSADGELFAAGFGRWIGVWHSTSGELVHDIDTPFAYQDDATGYGDAVVSFDFSSDGKQLYAGFADYNYVFVDLHTGGMESSAQVSNRVVGLTLKSGEPMWASADGTVWPQGIAHGQAEFEAVFFSEDGCQMACQLHRDWRERNAPPAWEVWEVGGPRLAERTGWVRGYHPKLGLAEESYDKSLLLGGNCYRRTAEGKHWDFSERYLTDGRAVWELGQTKPLKDFKDGRVVALSGRMIAVSFTDRVEIHDLAARQKRLAWEGSLRSFAMSSDGRFWAAQAASGVVTLGGPSQVGTVWVRPAGIFRLYAVLDTGHVVCERSTVSWPPAEMVILHPLTGDCVSRFPLTHGECRRLEGSHLLRGCPPCAVERLDLTTGAVLEVANPPAEVARRVRHRPNNEFTIIRVRDRFDVNSVVHGGRRLYDFQKTSPCGELVVVQAEGGAAVLSADCNVLGRVSFAGLPIDAHFGDKAVSIFTNNGELYRWQR